MSPRTQEELDEAQARRHRKYIEMALASAGALTSFDILPGGEKGIRLSVRLSFVAIVTSGILFVGYLFNFLIYT